MRSIAQPGFPDSNRIQYAAVDGRSVTFTLDAGVRLVDAVSQGFSDAGFQSGVLTLSGGTLGPFTYVMPALSKTGENAAFYSDLYNPPGVSRLITGAMTLGEKNGAPFFHCHALWREADGRVTGGHILPEETFVAETFDVTGFGISGAAFVAEYDPETNFTLFGPRPQRSEPVSHSARAFAVRLRPNQDFATALEAFCASQKITDAVIHGGVGSIIGARFVDGSRVEPFVTEMAVKSGRVFRRGSGDLEAELSVALVDHMGGVAYGLLLRGDNPVLMTMELVVEAIEGISR